MNFLKGNQDSGKVTGRAFHTEKDRIVTYLLNFELQNMLVADVTEGIIGLIIAITLLQRRAKCSLNHADGLEYTLSLDFYCGAGFVSTYNVCSFASEFCSPLVHEESDLRTIFINYRRNDSEGEAGRLFDELVSRFNPESVFMDVAAIEPGRDFRKAIDQSIGACSVLLALIGQDWLGSKDAFGQRRLDDANDFVRIELASALRRDIPVVPVLVRGAKMPRAEQLPDDLKELAYRNAVELTHARWKSDVQVLIQALKPHMEVGRPGTSDAPILNGEEDAHRPGEETRPARQSKDFVTAVSPIAPQEVERVIMLLASYIGPFAEVIVKRAAKHSSSPEELYQRSAQEVESEADKAKFLKSCRA